jgi:hypothetical protein
MVLVLCFLYFMNNSIVLPLVLCCDFLKTKRYSKELCIFVMFVIYVCMYFKGFKSNDYDPWGWARCVQKTSNQDDFIIEQNMATCKWYKKLCDDDSRSQRK